MPNETRPPVTIAPGCGPAGEPSPCRCWCWPPSGPAAAGPWLAAAARGADGRPAARPRRSRPQSSRAIVLALSTPRAIPSTLYRDWTLSAATAWCGRPRVAWRRIPRARRSSLPSSSASPRRWSSAPPGRGAAPPGGSLTARVCFAAHVAWLVDSRRSLLPCSAACVRCGGRPLAARLDDAGAARRRHDRVRLRVAGRRGHARAHAALAGVGRTRRIFLSDTWSRRSVTTKSRSSSRTSSRTTCTATSGGPPAGA